MTPVQVHALMRFLARTALAEGCADHVYVVGGAVRNHLLGAPIKDLDVVTDSVTPGGTDSSRFAEMLKSRIPVEVNLTTNQYGVAILSVKGAWVLDGVNLRGVVIEIANARKEAYEGAGGKGKGYKPTDVSPATIEEDTYRREFTFNTLLWRLRDLENGPEGAEILDPTGRGLADLEAKLIRTPVDPDKTFRDDPTRQLRVVKFLLRYGMSVDPEVQASVRRNAHRLKDMPWEAVGSLFVNDILSSSAARWGLAVLQELGMLPVLVEMLHGNAAFFSYFTSQLANGRYPVALLLDLADLGIAGRVLSFVLPEQRGRLRDITARMGDEEAHRFLALLRQPPIHSEALFQEFNLEGRERGQLPPIAREFILTHPDLAYNGLVLTDYVRRELRDKRPIAER